METLSQLLARGGEEVQDANEQGGVSNHSPSPLPELRLVLLGRKGAGKSSTGNTILGMTGAFESGKTTEECVKRRADITGVQVTVVDTPGWEWYYSVNGTPSWVRRETMRSMSICSPGPHALLLVVRSCTSVTEDYQNQIEEHLRPFGEEVWHHTMVLFTRGDELGPDLMEQQLQGVGKAFQKLLQRSGNRYHVLENKRHCDDRMQVKELMRKMEEMVQENGGRHLEIDPLHLGLEAEGWRRAKDRRKRQRQMEAQVQRGAIRAVLMSDSAQPEGMDDMHVFFRGSRRLPELRMVLFGERETGKSSAGNAILCGAASFQLGQATAECVRKQAEVAGRLLTVVDTPGWECGHAGQTPERVKKEISTSVTLCPPGPHALLVTLRVDALVSATMVREHVELLGEGIWRHTMLLFTRGDQLREGVTIEQHIQGGGRDLHWLMEKCGQRYHVISSIDTCVNGHSPVAQITGLLEKIEKAMVGNRCVAFSPLVQEIQELGKLKNERFNQRLRELGEKLQRQETELKMMRKREVRSIRWFFDRKKEKGISPRKSKVEKEVEEAVDRVEDDRMSIMGELEDRMRWLTEDKEREIHDLAMENDRFIEALKQERRERENDVMKLEEKDREIEELREKVDEQQVKLLEHERLSMVKELERKDRECEMVQKFQDAKKEISDLRDWLIHEQKEKDELVRQIKEAQYEMEVSKQKHHEIATQNENEVKRKVGEIENKMERKLQEKEREIEILQLKAETKEKELTERQKEVDDNTEKEVSNLRDMIDQKTKEILQLQNLLQEQVKVTEEERRKYVTHLKQYNEMKDRLDQKDEALSTLKRWQKDKELKRDAEMKGKLQDNEEDIKQLKENVLKGKVDIDNLRQDIKQKQMEMEELKTRSQMESAKSVTVFEHLKKEYKEREDSLEINNKRLEDDMKKMKSLFQEKSTQQEEEKRLALKEKEKNIQELEQKNAEIERLVVDIGEKLTSCQQREESLGDMNKTMEKDLDGLRQRCEAYERSLETQRAIGERREVEIKELLWQYEEKYRINAEQSKKHLKEKEEEIELLNHTNHRQHKELEDMKAETKEREESIKTMRANYEQKLMERNAELDIKDLERERELNRRTQHLEENEYILKNNIKSLERSKAVFEKGEVEFIRREQRLRSEEQELEEIKQELQKKKEQGNSKEEALLDRENELVKRECELKDQEEKLSSLHKTIDSWSHDLQILQKTVADREKCIDMKTFELNHLQNELSNQKQDILTKEEELKIRYHTISVQQEELINKAEDVEKQRQYLEIKEKELTGKEERLVEKEEVVEKNKQKQLNELSEKREEELANIRQHLSERQHDLKKSEEDLWRKEQKLCAREKNMTETEHGLRSTEQRLENECQSLKKREDELLEREKKLRDEEHLLMVKQEEQGRIEHQLENITQELENSKQLQEKGKELWCEKKQGDEMAERVTQTIVLTDMQLKKCEDELNTKELMLNEVEEYLKKNEMLLKTKEEKLEKETQHNVRESQDLMKQRSDIQNQEYSLEIRKQELTSQGQQLAERVREIDIKEEDLRQRYKELDIKENNIENHELQKRTQENDLQKKEQQLRSIKETLKSQKHNQEKLQCELEGREKEISNRDEIVKKRVQELENWEKYLFNMELKIVNSEPNSGFRRWEETKWSESKQGKVVTVHDVCEEIGNEGKGWERKEDGENDISKIEEEEIQHMEETRSRCEVENTARMKLQTQHGTQEPNQDVADSTIKGQTEEDNGEDDEEDFFESSDTSILQDSRQGLSGSELRLVLIGESWSSRHPLRYTILGQDTEGSNPWKGQIAGKHLTMVELPGLKWRSTTDAKQENQQQLLLGSVYQCAPGPHAFLLLIPAYLSFTEQYRRAVEHTVSVLGEGAWKHTIVVFTWGETFRERAHQHILRNGDLQRLIGRCSDRYHVLDNRQRSLHMAEILKTVEEMVAGDYRCYYRGMGKRELSQGVS